MNRSLRFISISQKRASVTQRDIYNISEKEKSVLQDTLRNTFPDISGLLMLVTCNRTEIYFESEKTSCCQVLGLFITMREGSVTKEHKDLFECSNTTKLTVGHLLEVSAGLTSAVLGDAEIIHQIKKSYQFSMDHHMQGSILERAMQAVFKNHKRLSNETHFRDGTTSVAYKSLKVVHNFFQNRSIHPKKMLFIGAGDIIKQLFKYNSKFCFSNIYISNRTEEKAIKLSEKNRCEVYDWNKVLDNDLEGFDVIISAAGNCRHLIHKMPATSSKTLLIDLAVPENIDNTLAKADNITLFNIETISHQIEENKEKRLAAISHVKEIIIEELLDFDMWLQQAPMRELLAAYKAEVDKKVTTHFESNETIEDPNISKIVTDRIMRKLLKHAHESITEEVLDAIIEDQIALVDTSL